MRRPIVLLAVLAACGGASGSPPAATPPGAAEPATPAPPFAEQPIPADLRDPVERSIAVGQQLHVLDKVAAIGTDVLLANVSDVQNAGVVGYLPLQEGDAQGKPTGTYVVVFFTSDNPPRVKYEIRVASDTPPEFQAFEPPRDGAPGLAALVQARQLAIAAMPRSEQPMNPVLLPAPDSEDSVVVYLLAGTKQPNVAVLGRHFRALVPLGGTRVSSMQPLSNGSMEIPTRGPGGEPVEGLIVSHVIGDFPLETHVFASLLHQTTLYVVTRRGAWRIEGERVSFLGEKGLGEPH
jgi:hypothetical protein